MEPRAWNLLYQTREDFSIKGGSDVDYGRVDTTVGRPLTVQTP